MTYMTTNPNLAVCMSDVHQSAQTEAPDWVYTSVENGRILAGHITSLMPSVVIVTGDCCSNWANQDDQDSFKNDVYNRITPTPKILRGNHDEDEAYGEGTSTSFATFDATFPGLPYHWTADWAAPNIRFIGFHSQIIHTGDYANYAEVLVDEVAWIATQLAALGTGQLAILCTHFPLLTAIGNNIHATGHQAELLGLMANNSTKIAAYLGGHRHIVNAPAYTQDGITHISLQSAAVSGGQGFMLVEYRPSVPDLVFHYRRVGGNCPMFGAEDAADYTPHTISL